MEHISETAADETEVEFDHFVNTDVVAQTKWFLACNKYQDHLEKLLVNFWVEKALETFCWWALLYFFCLLDKVILSEVSTWRII